ncbi:MAG: hypothetical protein RMH77_06905, partial [Sulfolobales archaeon]|nr:hypothetical protein [Sulfolobales archaeon]
ATWSSVVSGCDQSLELEIRAGNYTTITRCDVSGILAGNIYTVRITTLSGTYTYDVRAIQV